MAKNKHALTAVPINHWGWPIEKDIEKDKTDKLIKIRFETDIGKLMGKLMDNDLLNIYSF
jgi:hypothetical protein